MRKFSSTTRAIALTLLAGMFCACGRQPQSQHLLDQNWPALMLTFPVDRDSSALIQTTLMGPDAEERSASAILAGSALELPPCAVTQFAEYRFQPPGGSPDSLNVRLEAGPASNVYIGVAEYSKQRWQFFGPFNQSKTLALDDIDCISPNGNTWVAILAIPGPAVEIDELELRTLDPPNFTPVAAFTSDVSDGELPLTVAFDASASMDPDGDIALYEWDWNNDGVIDAYGPTAQASYTFAVAGEYYVRLRVTDNLGGQDTLLASAPVTVHGWANVKPGPDGRLNAFFWS